MSADMGSAKLQQEIRSVECDLSHCHMLHCYVMKQNDVIASIVANDAKSYSNKLQKSESFFTTVSIHTTSSLYC